jgi:hypothetical protein
MHKLSDASFTVKDEDGKDKTIKGGLYLDADQDAVSGANADTNLGNVVFRTAPNTDAQAEKQAQK